MTDHKYLNQSRHVSAPMSNALHYRSYTILNKQKKNQRLMNDRTVLKGRNRPCVINEGH